MAGKCFDKRFEKMLYAYELNLLSEEDRRELEAHLIECNHCFELAREMEDAAELIRRDPDIRRDVHEDLVKQSSLQEKGTDKSGEPDRHWLSRYLPATLVTAAIVVLLLLKPWYVEVSTTDEAIAAENRLAVMYFENLADKDDSDRLGDIATNLLITDLSESQYVRVVSTQRLYDAFKLLGYEDRREVDEEMATEVAYATGARWILMGSIIEDKPQLVITTQLVDVLSGDVEGSEKIRGDSTDDIFTLVDELAARIREDISLPAEALNEPDPQVAEITTHSPEAYRHYVEGVQSIFKVYHDDAIRSFRAALEIDSTFAMAWYRLALITPPSEQPEYIARAKQCAAQASRNERYLINSIAAQREGDVTGAITELEKLVEHYSDDKEAYFWLARLELGQGHFRKAMMYYDQALKIDPLYKAVYNEYAYLYQSMGDLEGAMWAMDKYMELAPGEANPYDTRAEMHLRNGDIDLAIKDFEKALEIKPDFYHSLLSLARLYLLNGNHDRGQECLDRLASAEPTRFRVPGMLGKAYVLISQGQLHQALEYLEGYVAAEGENDSQMKPSAYISMARLYEELGDYEKSLRMFDLYSDAYRELQPGGRIGFRYYRARLLAASGRIDEAEDFAENLKATLDSAGSSLLDYHRAVGLIALIQGDYARAIPALEDGAVDGSYYPRYVLGLAYLETHQYYKAAVQLEGLTWMQGYWNSYHWIREIKLQYHLGRCYEGLGEYGKAKISYEAFLTIWKGADSNRPEVLDAQRRLDEVNRNPRAS